ncbi:MAG: alpha/beta hydrolase [Clostridiales bacterium]|nr:alpha/beta hydrolase [Clostridiales bacterium]
MKISVGGFTVNYTDEGSGEVLVILQGWGTHAELYASLSARLSHIMRVIVPDLPGFGQTREPPEPWCADDYADFVLDFLSALKISRAYLLGHSNGGRITMKLVTRPSGISVPKIVLMDSSGIVPAKTPGQKLSLRLYKAAKALLSTRIGTRLFPGTLDRLREKRGSADYKAASPLMRATMVKLVNEDFRTIMPMITQPTLLIWGDKDSVTPISDARIMEKLIPDAGIVTVSGAGHYSFLDRPEHVGRVLEYFLGGSQ